MPKNHPKIYTEPQNIGRNVLKGGIWRCLKGERDIGRKSMLSDVKTAFRWNPALIAILVTRLVGADQTSYYWPVGATGQGQFMVRPRLSRQVKQTVHRTAFSKTSSLCSWRIPSPGRKTAWRSQIMIRLRLSRSKLSSNLIGCEADSKRFEEWACLP